ncbi:MAG: hypothetical protein KGZ59_00940 [Chitinophagaceae bacterium]|jgi:hypothetical protein|nr:hypothetical protein [Chitinophagaceae bacterium]HPH36140.1 hypothetical protein [Sediminibacterium sp.]
MKLLIFLLSLSPFALFAQKKNKFSFEINYGLNGNFFVRSYEEQAPPFPVTEISKKNFIGTVGGIELKYKVTKRASWGFGFAKSSNQKAINYTSNVNGVVLSIKDFDIKHVNHFYQLFYEREIIKKIPALKSQIGLFYLRPQQQEVSISRNGFLFEQRNFKNSYLEEGGIFVGLHYSKKIDTKFELGVKSRVYYLISTNSIEAVTFTPTLTYLF